MLKWWNVLMFHWNSELHFWKVVQLPRRASEEYCNRQNWISRFLLKFLTFFWTLFHWNSDFYFWKAVQLWDEHLKNIATGKIGFHALPSVPQRPHPINKGILWQSCKKAIFKKKEMEEHFSDILLRRATSEKWKLLWKRLLQHKRRSSTHSLVLNISMLGVFNATALATTFQ